MTSINEQLSLLLTGSINVKDYTVAATTLTNTEDRLRQYMHSICYAIVNYRKISHIVFCENTSFSYDYSWLYEIANMYGKILEIITFQGDYVAIQKQGKGYGEGEIIEYAVQHSKVLSTCFYKLTGRVVVENMDAIVNAKDENIFMFNPMLRFHQGRQELFVSTLFYKTNVYFYKNILIDAYKAVDDWNGYFLEHSFYDKLFPNKTLCSFKKYPIIIGVSGSTGRPYTESTKTRLKNSIYNRLGFYMPRKNIARSLILFAIKLINLSR